MSDTSFKRTVRAVLHQRASSFLHECAGHGSDLTTIQSYLDSLSVFESHFTEWANPLSDEDVIASLPTLHTLMPGMSDFRRTVLDVTPRQFIRAREAPIDELRGKHHEPPKAVAVVATMAMQAHLSGTREVEPDTGGALNALFGRKQ